MIKNIEYTYSTPDGGKQVINNTIPISELIRQQIDLKTYLYYNLLPRGDVEGGAGGEGIEF
ncbi:MAG: hypothetical protein OEZ22_14610 [Spirochaetia bacterium]|nr:hypothetical protein [Spirochaetia bacterium]